MDGVLPIPQPASGSAPCRKKLIDVAKAWATNGHATVDQTVLESLKASGAPDELVEQKRAELQRSIETQQVEIWPEHWHCCALFFAMATQWNISIGMGGAYYQGLRYEVLDTVQSRLPAIPDAPDLPDGATLFWQIQTLERAALVELNKEK